MPAVEFIMDLQLFCRYLCRVLPKYSFSMDKFMWKKLVAHLHCVFVLSYKLYFLGSAQ